MNRRKLAAFLGIVFVIFLAGYFVRCHVTGRQQSCTKQFFAMDTFMSFTAYGKDSEAAVNAAVLEVQRLDALLSAGSVSSEISALNASGSKELSEDTMRILERAQRIYQDTGGFFVVTIYPLMKLWGFPTREYHVPDEEELSEILPLVDASKLQHDQTTFILGEGQQVDLGGIAKGYASSQVMDIFHSYEIESGMVSLGGNVQVIGRRPDGNRWQVGIQDPKSVRGEVLAVLETEDRAVITSGGYERYFEEDGKTYIHIIDPRTGYPADSDLESVTVVSSDGMLADALSTALYIMGYDGAVDYWKAHKEEFDMILITDSGAICVTEGIQEGIRSDAQYSVVSSDGV